MTDSLLNRLHETFSHTLHCVFPDLESPPHEVTKSTQEQFGHYQCNSALKLAPLVKMAPRQIAEKLVGALKDSPDEAIEKLEIAGPGFINIWIAPAFLAKECHKQLEDSLLLVGTPKKERIIVDFSCPNTAKEMHVGHLRSTIIGDSLARIFEFLGHDVLRLNHIGDWGTSFGMLIAALKENYKQVPEAITLTDLVRLYKAAKKRFDEDADFKKRAQLEVVALQSGQKECIALWHKICEISRKAYQEIYDLLDVKLIERGESFYNPMLAPLVKELEEKGLVTLSDGAKCIFLEGFCNREGQMMPLMVQKSDGGFTYDTTDLAALRQRVQDEKADRIIYVTDSGQSSHFAMIFQAGIKAHYVDPKKVRLDHVPFGLVLGPDGKKFKTRSGETEKLLDLIVEAISRADSILKERNPDWSEVERKACAKALGIGAIKYADLSCNRVGDYSFSYDRMLRFEGNTVAFVMYSYVRACSIQRKVNADINALIKTTKIALNHPQEIDLALHLVRFPEVIDQIVDDLLPNRLTDYLYSLAEKFNLFFRDCQVVGTGEQNERLLLVHLTQKVFARGFHLLGIQTVEKM